MDIRDGKLYSKINGINPRWINHTWNNRVTIFFALLDVYGEIDDTKNITPIQIQKSM